MRSELKIGMALATIALAGCRDTKDVGGLKVIDCDKGFRENSVSVQVFDNTSIEVGNDVLIKLRSIGNSDLKIKDGNGEALNTYRKIFLGISRDLQRPNNSLFLGSQVVYENNGKKYTITNKGRSAESPATVARIDVSCVGNSSSNKPSTAKSQS